jgi:type IV fimbrial biogenesis protein FimT
MKILMVRRAATAVQRAFTLIEMMIVMALMAIIVMLVAPNFNEMIGMQRLRAINEQLVTDMQYIRSEAVSRNEFLGFLARNEAGEPMSCYVLFGTNSATLLEKSLCNCTNAVGAVCTGGQREVRTVQLPRNQSIELRWHVDQGGYVKVSPITGGLEFEPPDSALFSETEFCVEVRRSPRGRLRTSVGWSGRVSSCSPDGSVPGVAVCPAYDATIKNCKAMP